MYYRQCGSLTVHPLRPNHNMAPLGPKRSDGGRECGGPWMSMLMLTEGDAKYAASHLTMHDDGFVYVAHPNFMGYEGPDWGVSRHMKSTRGHAGPYVDSVCRDHLAHICWDRPIVPQDDAFDQQSDRLVKQMTDREGIEMACECGFETEVCATNPCMRKKAHLAGLTPDSHWPKGALVAPNVPYQFCRTPDKCAGKGYCQAEIACND